MKLPEVIEALGEEVADRANWTVAVLTRRRKDGTMNDSVLQYAIFDISVDHEDSEINLLTDEESETPRPATQALTLETLLKRLKQLERECSSYSVFSGSAFVSLDDEWEGRYDPGACSVPACDLCPLRDLQTHVRAAFAPSAAWRQEVQLQGRPVCRQQRPPSSWWRGTIQSRLPLR